MLCSWVWVVLDHLYSGLSNIPYARQGISQIAKQKLARDLVRPSGVMDCRVCVCRVHNCRFVQTVVFSSHTISETYCFSLGVDAVTKYRSTLAAPRTEVPIN